MVSPSSGCSQTTARAIDLASSPEHWTDAGIVYRRTRPYRPQTNGKVERSNLTLKWEWAYARPYGSNESRSQELERWLHSYNYHRPHMAHAGRPPITTVNNVPGEHT